MQIKIIFYSYFLTYMYGNQPYEDPLLLSREIIKKAYHEGLYYISSKKNIDKLINNQQGRTIYVFAGLPTFIDICLTLYPDSKLEALKINLPYEQLSSFTFDEEEKVLIANECYLDNYEITELYLNYNKKLEYLTNNQNTNLISSNDEIRETFIQELKNYIYVIKSTIEYLRNSLVNYVDEKIDDLDDNELSLIKDCYEELYLTTNN